MRKNVFSTLILTNVGKMVIKLIYVNLLYTIQDYFMNDLFIKLRLP